MGPWLSFFGRLINSIRQLMKYFSSFDANLSFYFIVRIDIHLFNRFCSNFCRCDDNFYTDVKTDRLFHFVHRLDSLIWDSTVLQTRISVQRNSEETSLIALRHNPQCAVG